MRKILTLTVCILIPLAAGFVGNLLGNSAMGFADVAKPGFAPPAIVFPIVWTVLYILMGVSCYLIVKSDGLISDPGVTALRIYGLQLFCNTLWTFFFFNRQWYFFSFLWILLLIILVAIMIILFFKINKAAGLLQIPYLLWLCFAAVLAYIIWQMQV